MANRELLDRLEALANRLQQTRGHLEHLALMAPIGSGGKLTRLVEEHITRMERESVDLWLLVRG